MRGFSTAVVFSILLFAIWGCGNTSPAVGTWKGTVNGNAEIVLVLNPDHKGTYSLSIVKPTFPITWEMVDSETVTFQPDVSRSSEYAGKTVPPQLTRKLTMDKEGKAMTMDTHDLPFGSMLSATLTKQ